MALVSRTQARVASATRQTRMVAAPSRVRSVVVRANETAAPEKAAFSAPTLNPDTPSPIFGGSTGGLLRKAQVRGGFGAPGGVQIPHWTLQQRASGALQRPRPPVSAFDVASDWIRKR